MSLNTIQQDIERSIENALYQTLLSNGLIPDRDLFAGNSKGYEAAKAAILSSKKLCVDLYGNGAPADRDNKAVPRITVEGGGFLLGDTGNDFSGYHEMRENQKYSLFKPAAMLSNYRFGIRLSSNSTSHDRILEAVRQTSLPNLDYIIFYNDPKNPRTFDPDRFLIRYAFTKVNPDLTFGLIEKVYVYEAVDIVEQLPRELKGGISPIKEITVDDQDSQEIYHKTSQVIVANERVELDESSNTILN